MYGEDLRYGIANPPGALLDVAKDGNPMSSAVHLNLLKTYH